MIGLLVANLMACQRVKVEEPFEANIKSSQESPYGSLAAYDGDGSIYYYSNHRDIPGIYKMDLTGTEREFMVPCKDIKKMQIKNNILYYLEYETDIHDGDMLTKGYRLMQYDIALSETKKIELYERGSLFSPCGTWNFCVGDKGIIFTDLALSAPKKEIRECVGIKNFDGTYLKSMLQVGVPRCIQASNQNFYLYDYGDLYCVSRFGNESLDEDEDEPYVDYWMHLGIYDKGQNVSQFGNSPPNARTMIPRAKIIGRTKELLLSYADQLVLYDADQNEIQKEYVFENTMDLNNAKAYGNKIIIIGKTKDAKDQIIYIDKQNETKNQLFEASEEEHVLYFDQEHYILFDQGKITKNTYSGDEVWTVNLGKIWNTEGYKTDTSGDRLFVTHWNKRKKVRELDAMINIVTGEVMEHRGSE